MKLSSPLLPVLFCCVLCSPLPAAPPANTPLVRWPAVAGANYPADPDTLLTKVKELFAQADVPQVNERLVAVIASPAPYGLAGKTTAHAFKSLEPGQYDRVILLAPGHGPAFENCSIPSVDVFMTPLGPVPLDGPAIRHLMYSPLFHAHQIRYDGVKPQERIHEYEFAVESLLPYLQERLLEFTLVPILVGDLRDPEGQTSENAMGAFADAIRSIMEERTLVVVASSFTHYGKAYENEPFKEDIQNNIAHLDRLAFEQVLGLNLKGFRTYLKETKNVIDGKDCIQILMKLLPARTQARLLAYAVSGEISGKWDNSVSYASLVFHDMDAPALSARPDKVRPLVLRKPEKTAAPPETGPGKKTDAGQ